jgi:DNA-binding Lrp family transcriptional regulator
LAPKTSRATLADDIFRKRPAMNYSDIVAYLTAKKGLKLSERTAARRIAELSRLGLIEKSAVGLWTPSKKR